MKTTPAEEEDAAWNARSVLLVCQGEGSALYVKSRNQELDDMVMLMLQVRRLRCREVNSVAQGYRGHASLEGGASPDSAAPAFVLLASLPRCVII